MSDQSSSACPQRPHRQDVDLDDAIGDAELDLILLEIVIEEISSAQDAFEFFKVAPGGSGSLRLVSIELVRALNRVALLMRTDHTKIAKAFYGDPA